MSGPLPLRPVHERLEVCEIQEVGSIEVAQRAGPDRERLKFAGLRASEAPMHIPMPLAKIVRRAVERISDLRSVQSVSPIGKRMMEHRVRPCHGSIVGLACPRNENGNQLQ